jgi:hypothetical protein
MYYKSNSFRENNSRTTYIYHIQQEIMLSDFLRRTKDFGFYVRYEINEFLV